MVIISKFSGKCDFADHIFMSSEDLTKEELFNKFNGTKLYKYKQPKDCVEITDIKDMNKNWEEVEYHSLKDLIPYYPYIIALGFCDNKNSTNSTIVLSSESYVDSSERESLEFMLKDILRYYNRYKRKKESFNKEEVLSKVCWNKYNEYAYKELIDRVDKYGKKANINGIELSMSKIYREELRKELERYENY